MTTNKIRVRPSTLTMPVYQRTPNVRRAKNMAAAFEPDAIGAITVAVRPDGAMVVVDGGHRVLACKYANYDDKIYAIAHEGLTLQDEARLFLELNDSRQLVPYDRFVAALHAEDQTALTIDRVLRRHGWQIGKGKAVGCVAAVTATEKIVGSAPDVNTGGERLSNILGILTAAWGHDGDAVPAEMLDGVGKVLKRYPEADHARLAKVLSAQMPRLLKAQGVAQSEATGWTRSSGIAAKIVDLYNSRLKSGRLPDWVWKN